MQSFCAPPGMVLVQADVSALEPNTLAHFSQDPALLTIYGKDAWQGHDVYLVAGMKVPGIAEKITPHYTLQNYSTEGVAAAKAAVGKDRGAKLKPAMLGWLYGIGAETLHVNLEISLAEARTIIRGLETQFPGKARLQQRLEREWAISGGVIINGRGRPLCVDFGKKKDLTNRLVQSSGHDCLVRILLHMNSYRKEHGINMRPFVADIHDETVWCCPPEEVERAKDCINYAFDQLNKELNWTVTIKHGGINVGNDLSIRCD